MYNKGSRSDTEIHSLSKVYINVDHVFVRITLENLSGYH